MNEYNPEAKIVTIDPAEGVTNSIPLKQWNDPKVKKFCPHCRHATETRAWQSGQIQFLRGRPSDPVVLATVAALAAEAGTVLVMEDSNHLTEVRLAQRNRCLAHSADGARLVFALRWSRW